MSKRIKSVLGIAVTLLIILPSLLYAEDKGKYERYKTKYYSTHYRNPTWLNNERIIFVKQVSYYKRYFLPIESEFYAVRTDYYICSMKTDGTDERIIRQFSAIYDKKGEKVAKRVMVEDGKEIPVEEGIYPRRLDCSSKKGLITFDGDEGNIYIMKTDGFNLTKIAEEGRFPKYSPDGIKILYNRTEEGLYIMNSDGSNKYKVVDGNVWGIWHPDGKRIVFEYSSRKDCYPYMINIDGTGKERFIETGVGLEDWSPDGSRFIAGSSMYTADGKEIWNDRLGTHSSNPKRYCIPRNARFSPDGTKIVGDSIHEPRGEIAILSSDFTRIKVLRKNEINY